MAIFTKNEINTSRQYEFDLAKAVCILGMVFVHCFEMLPLQAAEYNGSLYYTLVIVLDAIFGAGTFMVCLGIGLTYTGKNSPDDFIRRGIGIFALGYVLNFFRYSLPSCLYFFTSDPVDSAWYVLYCFMSTDIMQFAGLAFLLFGLLKKLRLPDPAIGAIAIAMSVAGSYLRFIKLEPIWPNLILGLFIGTRYESDLYTYSYKSSFALMAWFVFVVFGYFYGKIIRRCKDTDKFYAITTPVSAAILSVYMAVAIPNKLGMMCGEDIYYFQMTTPDALIIITGAVFVFGMYHYVLKLFSSRAKAFVSRLAVNINTTYCIHWVVLGWLSVILWMLYEQEGIANYILLIISAVIYLLSTFLAELVRKIKDKKVSKNASLK